MRLGVSAGLQARLRVVARLLGHGRVSAGLVGLQGLPGAAFAEVVDGLGLGLAERLVALVAQRPRLVTESLGLALELGFESCIVPGVEQRAEDLLALLGV